MHQQTKTTLEREALMAAHEPLTRSVGPAQVMSLHTGPVASPLFDRPIERLLAVGPWHPVWAWAGRVQ